MMRRSMFVVLTVSASVSIGLAQPKPAVKAAAASKCVPNGEIVFNAATKLLVTCEYDDKNCHSLDPVSKAIKAAAVPSKPSFHLNKENDAACVGVGDSDCVKLGKRALAAATKLITDTKDGQPPSLRLTISQDRAFVILAPGFGGGTVWNVKKDKPINVKAWASGGEGGEGGVTESAIPVGFVGDLLVYSVIPCAGPCMQSKLYSRTGKAIGKSFDGVADVVRISDDVSVGLSQDGGMARISAKAKKAVIWSDFKEGAVESGTAFVLDGVPYMAFADFNSHLMVYKMKPDATAKESVFSVDICQN
jgi:hypothetical protein